MIFSFIDFPKRKKNLQKIHIWIEICFPFWIFLLLIGLLIAAHLSLQEQWTCSPLAGNTGLISPLSRAEVSLSFLLSFLLVEIYNGRFFSWTRSLSYFSFPSHWLKSEHGRFSLSLSNEIKNTNNKQLQLKKSTYSSSILTPSIYLNNTFKLHLHILHRFKLHLNKQLHLSKTHLNEIFFPFWIFFQKPKKVPRDNIEIHLS